MISIIIPVRNEAQNISKNLSHLQELRRRNSCEIILVDGGSTDNTTEIANNLVDHILKTKLGRAVQQNIGASIAKGNTLVFLHADTYITAKQLLSIKEVLKKNNISAKFPKN